VFNSKKVPHMIKRIAAIGAVALVITIPVANTARAADLSEPAILVASENLSGSAFEQTVVIATPVRNGGYIGFIVNRPTTLKLEALFPDEPPAREVKEPVYIGGPVEPRAVFALTQSAPLGAAFALPLMPGLVAVLDVDSVNRIIERTPNAARYFVGCMLWQSGELEQEIEDNLWEVRPVDVRLVFRAHTQGLWNALRKPMASADRFGHSQVG
jgi:putative transcriptional regulator